MKNWKKVAAYLARLSLKKKIMITGLLLAILFFWFSIPNPLFTSPTSFVIESRDGELLSAATAEDGQWRFPQNEVAPGKFKTCIVAFEDKRFHHHPGIDVLALGRALRLNVSKGRTVSGGSTLSMQVIRLASPKQRTFWNKLLEALKALRLELTYSKEEILLLYASNAPFGTNVVGLEAASWRYYGRPSHKLSWGEMAALAVLPNAPSLVHPGKNRDKLIRKRNRLLDILEKDGQLSTVEVALAKQEPVPDKPLPLPQLAPHLLSLVRNDFKAGKLQSTRIRTSVNKNLQVAVARILNQHQERLAANLVNNCAALILEVETGQVLSYNGNIYKPEQVELESYVDVIQAPRSPGSTLKPLLYAAMINEGMLLPESLLPDVPTVIAGYQPNNNDLGYDGAVPASKALARSLNVPAVKMLQQYRYERFHDFLRNLGFSTLNKPADFYGLSLILGGGENTLWELSGVYGSMARTLNHFDANGSRYNNNDWRLPSYQLSDAVKPARTETHGRVSAASIFQMFQAMNEVIRPGEDYLWKQFSSSQQIAWKTGTSFGFRDGWAIGITPGYVVAVWAGNTDGEGRPGLTGIDAAAPILFDIYRLLPASRSGWFKAPLAEMVEIEVCKESGFKAGEQCEHREPQLLPRSCLKSQACNFHKLIHLDASGKFQVSSDCESPSKMIHKHWFVLPPVMEYYFKTKNYSYKPLPSFRPDCQVEQPEAMEFIYPKNNAIIYVPYEIDGNRGQLILSAAHRKTNGLIYWHLDGRFLGTTREIHQLAVSPAPGKHLVTIVDEAGNRIHQYFTILDKENI
ncbi:penicillin-binding protein 1C [Pedobacter sp. SYSU D00535]|uniref:penicillin-binding protein 1C n=1 Tax=Pedobacter sp. SYSU D00535 TaxID=2810308 RepID=UPI001A977F61|nr:penicillin-binding protein 1C [Pedobacter sp. SYSU D00535]